MYIILLEYCLYYTCISTEIHHRVHLHPVQVKKGKQRIEDAQGYSAVGALYLPEQRTDCAYSPTAAQTALSFWKALLSELMLPLIRARLATASGSLTRA